MNLVKGTRLEENSAESVAYVCIHLNGLSIVSDCISTSRNVLFPHFRAIDCLHGVVRVVGVEGLFLY